MQLCVLIQSAVQQWYLKSWWADVELLIYNKVRTSQSKWVLKKKTYWHVTFHVYSCINLVCDCVCIFTFLLSKFFYCLSVAQVWEWSRWCCGGSELWALTEGWEIRPWISLFILWMDFGKWQFCFQCLSFLVSAGVEDDQKEMVLWE